eukprot:182585_1
MPKYAFLVLIYLAMSGNLTSAEDSKLITIDSLKKSKSSVTGEIEEALWFNISKEEHKLLSRYRYTFSISSRLSPRHLVRHSSFGAIRGVDRFDDPRQANSRYVTYHLHKDAQWITVYERPRNAPEGGDHHETDIILQRINFAKFRKNIVYCPSLNARTLEVLDPTGMSSSSYLLDTLENCLYTPTDEDCFVKCKGAQHKFKIPEEDSARLTCVRNSQDTFQFALRSACGGTQVSPPANPCAGIVCNNKGKCHSARTKENVEMVPVNGTCVCADGYKGALCDTEIVCETLIAPEHGNILRQNPSLNGQALIKCGLNYFFDLGSAKAEYTRKCVLNAGKDSASWSGDADATCKFKFSPPANPCAGIVCNNKGKCQNGTCVCADGYKGTFCDTARSTSVKAPAATQSWIARAGTAVLIIIGVLVAVVIAYDCVLKHWLLHQLELYRLNDERIAAREAKKAAKRAAKVAKTEGSEIAANAESRAISAGP